jgi:O-antigen/teichoic acid export membrane protein
MSQAAPPLSRSGFLFTKASDLFVRASRKGFWPMLDQGVVSFGNFLTTIMVARGLGKHEYSTFGMALEFMFYLNNLHGALVTFPLTVKSAVTDEQGLQRFATASSLLTMFLGIPLAIVTLIVGGTMGQFWLGASAVVALMLWQLQETTRRGLWAHFRHGEAIVGDFISYVGQAFGVWLLIHNHKLNLVTIFSVMSATSGVAALVQILQVGMKPIDMPELKAIARQFWLTGRWVAFTNLSAIATSITGSWALRLFHNAEQVADFFAIGNLLKLCNPIMASIAGLITPAAAKKLAYDGVRAAERITAKFTILGAAMLLPYLLFILVLPTLALKLAYGRESHYLGQELALRGCVIGYFILYLSGNLTAFLNGIEKTRYSFYGQIATAVAQFVILLPANIVFGLQGYVWGGVVMASVQLVVFIYLVKKAIDLARRQSAAPLSRTVAPEAFPVVK